MDDTFARRVLTRVAGTTLGPIQVRAGSSGPPLSADVRDVSIQGIGLLLDQALLSGTDLVIEGGSSGKALGIGLNATVRHATMLTNGRWLIGCAFSRCLTADDFHVLA